MAQQIGLEAIFDISGFQKGMGQYTSSLGKAVSETDRASGSFTKSFNAMGSAVTKVTAIMGGALVAAGLAAGAAVGKFAIDGISQARDLEKQMSSIAAVLNMTAQEAAPLNDLILELGIDPNLSVSATEAADAIEMLARNGLSMGEIMDGAARSTVLLANATGADLAVAADISTDAMAIFKIGVDDMASAVNGITAVTNSSKFSIDDYALALAQGGGVAAASGVEFDEFNTSIAAISPLFASGSDAGTSYKTMIQRLVPQSKAAAEAMQTLGLDFFDANGQMKSMAEIASELNDAFMQEVTFSTQVSNMTAEQTAQKAMLEGQMKKLGMELFKYEVGLNGVAQSEEDKIVSIDRLNRQMDAAKAAYAGLAGEMGTTITTTRALTEEERNQYLTTIFGTDAMRAAIGMAESGTVVYTDLATAAKETGLSQDLLNQYIEGGITQFELLEAQMSLIDANEQAKTRMDNFAGALEILSGVIETIQIKIGQAFLPALTEMTRAFTAFIEEHSDSIVAFFESIATWLGTNIPIAIASLSAAWPTIQAGFAVLAEYVPIIVSGLTLIAGIVGTVLSAAFALVKDNMAAFQGALAGIALVMAGSVISAGLTAIAGALAVLLSPLSLVVIGVAALGAAWNTNFLGMQDKTVAALGVIQSAFAPLTSAIQQFGQGALTEVGLFVTGNETEFANAKAIWTGAQTSFQNVFGGISEWLTTNLPIFTANLTQWGTAAVKWIAESLPNLLTNLIGWWGTIVGFYAQYHPLFNGQLAGWAVSAWQWIADAMPTVTAKLGEWWGIISGYVAGQLPAWKTELTAWATAAWQWIEAAALFVGVKLAEWWTTIRTYVTGQLPAWKTALKTWTTAAWQWIVDAATSVAGKMGEWYAELSAYIVSQLPTWQAAFVQWANALWAWIVPAAILAGAAIATWASGLVSAVGRELPKLIAGMLEWATALVTWISSAEADALPHLGTWMGKILAWIALAVVGLIAKTAELAVALVGWIADAVPLIGPKFLEFTTALFQAIINVGVGLALAALNLATTFVATFVGGIKLGLGLGETSTSTVMSDIGTGIMNGLSAGIEAMKQTILDLWTTTVATWTATITDTDWTQLGKDAITAIKNGIAAMAFTARMKAQEVANDIKKKFVDLAADIVQVGKDIVQGLIDGIFAMKDTLIEKIKEFAQLLPDWMKYALGIESPSKVFAAIGVDTVKGLVQGINSQQNAAVNAIASLTDGMLRGVRSGTGRIIDSFSDAIGSLTSVGGSLLSRIEDSLGEGAAEPGVVKSYRQMEKGVELLQMQADLISLIRQAGMNPADVLAGVTLGANANPQQLLGIINTTMASMANHLNNSILVAADGLEFEIERLRAARRSVSEVEQNAIQSQLTQLERYRDAVAKIDEQIARREQSILFSGGDINQLKQLDEQRSAIITNIETYVRQQDQLQKKLKFLPSHLTGRAAQEAQKYIDRFINPLVQSFDQMDVSQRSATLDEISKRMDQLTSFSINAGYLGHVEKNILSAVDGFGEGVQQRVNRMIDILYNPLSDADSRNQVIGQLNALTNDLTSIQSRIDAQVGRHKSIDDFINELMPLDQIGYYKQQIGNVDAHLQRLNEQLLATGDTSLLERYTSLDLNRSEIEWELRKFLQQRQQFEGMMAQVAEMPTIGAAAAQKFYDSQLKPLIDAFARPMTEAQRLANMALTEERINALNAYINAMERFESMKVDLTSGMAGDPTMRNLTRIEQMLQNINTSEAERNRLMQEYRTEQEKLLAIQQKQQQLDFLNQQLNIVKQLETLNKDHDDIISVKNILSGITLGMNASVDDMITLTSRAIDAMIMAAQRQLGIASPSKVFEAMGRYVMQGLGKGISGAAMQPLNALRNVVSDMPYTLAQRNLTINMGGVAISNGMDEMVFEQRVRRIVNGMDV